ncbi:hypothetical protein [Phycicoccus sp. HDW14]|uniref:hypothetical protein n=1 Tax=Phycicoccus sp. HDW14 TaxID=2714941 RepID=UPI001F0E9E18|nr:hypothetical protein [Phycicoccus sp. HDW14]
MLFFVVPIGTVVWFSFGYKPGLFGTHANDVLSLDRYREALSPTFFATFQNTLWVGVAGTSLCLLIGLPTAYWMAVKAPPAAAGCSSRSSWCRTGPTSSSAPSGGR